MLVGFPRDSGFVKTYSFYQSTQNNVKPVEWTKDYWVRNFIVNGLIYPDKFLKYIL